MQNFGPGKPTTNAILHCVFTKCSYFALRMQSMKLHAFIVLSFAVLSTPVFAKTVSASGQFDLSAASTTLSAPDAVWSLSFNVNSPASDATPQGFNVPFSNFTYELNGSPVFDTPEYIRFFDASSGGMFTVYWGSETGYDSLGNSIPELSLSGNQLSPGQPTRPPCSSAATLRRVGLTATPSRMTRQAPLRP